MPHTGWMTFAIGLPTCQVNLKPTPHITAPTSIPFFPGNEHLPIYLTQPDRNVLAGAYPYLVDTSTVSLVCFYLIDNLLFYKATAGGGVAQLEWKLIDESHFEVKGMKFIPLPVEVCCISYPSVSHV